MNRREILVLILAFTAALALRIYFIPAPGYEQDIVNFKDWSQAAVEEGVHNMYDPTPRNSQFSYLYPPAYLYIQKAVGSFYKVFYPGFDEHTYLFDFAIKFPAILADILISIGIFIFLRKKHPFNVSFLAMAAYAFNPVIILNSAYWGQVDSVTSLFILGAILALVNDKFGWAWGLFTVGVLTKVQAGLLLPILVLITWKRKGLKTLFNSMAVSWCTFVLLLLPFFYLHKVDRLIDNFLQAVGEFPFLSLYAFNLWWLLSGGQGRWVSDSSSFFNLFSCRTAGTLLVGMFFVLLLRYLYYREKDEGAIFLGSALAFFSFFMLSTEMHERFVLLAFAFLLLAAVKDRNLKVVYGTLSLTTFLSLIFVLFWTYPKNYPPLPPFWQSFPVGMIISLINMSLFLFVLYMLVKDIKIKYQGCFLAAIIVVVAGFYFLKPAHPAFLSDLAPKTYQQQWGQLRMDHSVDGNRLKVHGFYYSKGLGTHAYSSIEYELGGRYRFLEGAVGLDDEANRDNKIEARIYADKRLIYKSGILQGRINPRYFRLNIAGAKVLRLVVTDGGDGINCDHGDWLLIRVLP